MEKAELRTLGVLITKVGYAAILTAIVDDLDEESRIADSQPPTVTVCRRKRSGNTPAAPGRRRTSATAIRRSRWHAIVCSENQNRHAAG